MHSESSINALSAPLLKPLDSPRAWRGEDLKVEDWRIPMPAEALAELDAVVAILRKDPLPVLMLSPADYALEACRALMARVREHLLGGVGLAVVDRLPLDRYSPREATAVYWLLGQLLRRLVAQKWDGMMIYDVLDSGKSYGYGVRASITNAEQTFHNDNAFGIAQPDFVSLLCLNPALSGGISRFCSVESLHNDLLAHHPQLLERLYRPFYFDRQAEHAPDDRKVDEFPALRVEDGQLIARLNEGLVRKGYSLAQEQIDPEGDAALKAVRDFTYDPANCAEFTMDRGCLQYLNNLRFLHSRTRFKDNPDPAKKRHMVRLWYRDIGCVTYNG